MLPGLNGLDLLKELRKEKSDVRVLILTALADEEDLLKGFQAGADDYMAKPFSPRELVARVEAQAGHGGADSVKARIEHAVDTLSFLRATVGR